MKRTFFTIFFFVLVSYAVAGGYDMPSSVLTSPDTEIKAAGTAQIPSALKSPETFPDCRDDTSEQFNSSGIEILPFLRAVFFDIDNDGIQEMIVGSKDGSLRLYKNSGATDNARWHLVENYFDGIRAGAFSSPAVGDIDNDGRPEVILGTGGFSSDSGRVVCYRNRGSWTRPLWEEIKMPQIRVGNDATPTLVDVDHDGRVDLVVGNSSGRLILFRNRTRGKIISFKKAPGYFRGINVGMYAVPAATRDGKRTVIVAGNSSGKLYIVEKTGKARRPWRKHTLPLSVSSFAAPAFLQSGDYEAYELAVSDGEGRLHRFKKMKDHKKWEGMPDFLKESIVTGPACSPSITEIEGRMVMVVGNINGTLKLFEYLPSSQGLPWVERKGFFDGIKLSGFSKGVMTMWQGKYLLVAGQQDGILRAFLNSGTPEKPVWVEQKEFFSSLPAMMHAAPSVFDIEGDGKWELIVGDASGYVYGFRYAISHDGMPVWEKMHDTFSSVRVDRFATPAIFRDSERLYLLVGQQDGKIQVFVAGMNGTERPVFYRAGNLGGMGLTAYSSPSAISRNGSIEISVGDYDGNLKHFTCKKNKVRSRVSAAP